MTTLIVILVLLLVFVYLLFPGHASRKKRAPFWGRNFAHRGLFLKDQSVPENSLEAFRRAVAGGYGMELDVQLSKDGQVVVFHDDTLERVCGVKKRVDALTFAELRELRLYSTEEQIPLFSEVLETVGGKTPLIVELKNGPRNRELCEKTCAL
ncbi:MAG: glycerophosphodiester phosphodiesterase, partial [Lachnospiraceae bacterium]|nr:glycerophosphodiester phosphodiesterase [Lachnospiraceae bacterium]